MDVIELIKESRREQLSWARRRLAALDKIEAKLREMRSLAVYAAGWHLSEREAAQVQEWVNILQAEINALDRATARVTGGNPVH